MSVFTIKGLPKILYAIFCSVLILIFPFSHVTATEANEAEKQFGFAESLYAEGDFYRAISEYKRLIYFYPNDKNIDKSYLGIVKSFFSAKRWNDCVSAVDKFIAERPSSSLRTEALYLKGVAEKNLKHFDEALNIFRDILKSGVKSWHDKALYQCALIFLEKEDWDQARSSFLLVPNNSPLYDSARNIADGLQYINDIPQKSPATAGVLAALFPCAGHLYTERPRDALVAFLLNASFIAAAVELYRHEHYWASGIVAFIELGWYSGNIYSAVNSAHKYNREMKGEFLERLKGNVSLSFHRDSFLSTPLIVFSSSF